MDIKEAIKSRHSVRYYKDEPIFEEARAELEALIDACNAESGLHMQLIVNDPECFNTLLAHYGMFKNVKNYIAIVGPKSMSDLDERGGYFGQKIVIAAQMLGLNTCWVAGTYRRGKCKADLEAGEKIVCVIAIGYGENEGTKHRSKPLAKVCDVAEVDGCLNVDLCHREFRIEILFDIGLEATFELLHVFHLQGKACGIGVSTKVLEQVATTLYSLVHIETANRTSRTCGKLIATCEYDGRSAIDFGQA